MILTKGLILAAAGIALIEAVSQTLLKKSVTPGSTSTYRIIGLMGYALVGVMLVYCYQHLASLSVLNITWNCFSTLFVTAAGIIIFKDNFGVKQWIGMGLSLVAIYLVNQEN